LTRGKRLIISVMAVALGIVLFLIVGPVIISLFGFTYKHFDNTWFCRPQEIAGTTSVFWLGIVISTFGLSILIGGLVGVVLYYWKKW
jgi:hypothetical protein